MSTLIKLEKTELTDADLRKVLGQGINIISYPDLAKYASLQECFGRNSIFIIFFETDSQTVGHWTMMLLNRKQRAMEFWDPYGLGIDCDKKYIGVPMLKKLKEYSPILTDMCADAGQNGFTVTANTVDYQSWASGVADCGRHVAVRGKKAQLSEQQYYNFLKQYMTSRRLATFDDAVTDITYKLLKK